MPDATADVVIVFAHNPQTDGPDLDRIGTVETYPRAQARRMVNTGEARWLDDPRNVDDGYVTAGAKSAPVSADGGTGEAPTKPLTQMNKTELRGLLPAATLTNLGDNPTRLELLAAARTAQEQDAGSGDAEPATEPDDDEPETKPAVGGE